MKAVKRNKRGSATDATAHGGASRGRGVPHSGTASGREAVVRAALLVFVVAVAVRVTAQIETADVSTVRHLVGDAAGYWQWGERIADGHWIGGESFYQAPLYPYTLGVLQTLGVANVCAVRLVQAVWGALGCVLVAAAAMRLFDRRVGVVAGLMLALYAPGVFYDGIIQKASLACLLTCAVLAAIGRCRSAPPITRLVTLGALIGLLCLTRENALLWLVILIIWVCWSAHRPHVVRGLVPAAFCLVGALLALAPACGHNAYVSGAWSVTTFQAGPNFFIGNSADADGRYRPLVRGHETPDFERRDATRLAEDASGHPLSPGEVSGYWMDRAWSDIAGAPGRWVRLLGLKLLMTVNAYEVADVESLHVHTQSSWVLSVLAPVWHFGVLCPLGVVGLTLSWRRHSIGGVYAVLLASMIVAVASFFVLGRYRLPLVPILVVFAAFGAVSLVDMVRSRQWREVSVFALPLIVVAVVCNLPVHDRQRLDALAAMNTGVAMAQVGEVERATLLFAAAVAVHPASPEANNNLAMALAVQERYGEAIPYYRRALVGDSTLLGVDYNLGVALERVGQVDEALIHYRRALELAPDDGEAQAAIARLTRNQ